MEEKGKYTRYFPHTLVVDDVDHYKELHQRMLRVFDGKEA